MATMWPHQQICFFVIIWREMRRSAIHNTDQCINESSSDPAVLSASSISCYILSIHVSSPLHTQKNAVGWETEFMNTPLTGHQFITGHTPFTHTHRTGNLFSKQPNLQCHWTVGGKQGAWRKHRQTLEEHEKSVQRKALVGTISCPSKSNQVTKASSLDFSLSFSETLLPLCFSALAFRDSFFYEPILSVLIAVLMVQKQSEPTEA